MFTPDADLVEKSHRIIAAMQEATAQGKGAVSFDGRLVDAASIRMAQTLLAKLEQIEAREQVTQATVSLAEELAQHRIGEPTLTLTT